jgi:hypothetical protein
MDPIRNDLINWVLDEGESHQSDVMHRWFTREDFNWLPTKEELNVSGLESVLQGWKPEKPIIEPSTRVIALGSCFARYFVLWLADHDFNQRIPKSPYNALIRNGSGFESAAVIAQQFRWAFDKFDSQNALWFDPERKLFEATEERRLLVRDSLLNTDVLIVTLGLSEVWYNNTTNEPLWRAIPRKYYDPQKHVFRVESFANTVKALEDIDAIRDKYLPNLKIIFTISPVRLKATFRPISALTANSVSKAILRGALDEFLRNKVEKLNKIYYYFPSFEIVMDVFKEPFWDDNRHLYDYVPKKILDVFARYYTTFTLSEDLEMLGKMENEELHEVIAQLEAKVNELQKVCDERLRVIQELDVAVNERLRVIEELDNECKRLRDLLKEPR